MPAKSLICKSNANRRRIVIAVPKRKGIFESSDLQNFHPDPADPENLTDSSESGLLLPKTPNEENPADVLSAGKKVILPKIVPTKETSPFVL